MEYLNELPAGLIGLIMAVIVYAAVFGMKRAHIVVTGNHARLANVLLSMFFAASQQDMAEIEQVLVGLVAAVASAAIHETVTYFRKDKDKAEEPRG
jgi:hypothetical protein